MPKADVALHPLVIMRTFSARLRARGRSIDRGLGAGRIGGRVHADRSAGQRAARGHDRGRHLHRPRRREPRHHQRAPERPGDRDRPAGRGAAAGAARGRTLQLIGSTSEPVTVAENGMCVEGSTGAWKYYSGAATSSAKPSRASRAPPTPAPSSRSNSRLNSSPPPKKPSPAKPKTGPADYIETSSSVTWPSIGTHAPISQSSLVAVPKSGTLLVKVTNRNNEPVPDATVAVSDRTSSAVTAEQTTPARAA